MQVHIPRPARHAAAALTLVALTAVGCSQGTQGPAQSGAYPAQTDARPTDGATTEPTPTPIDAAQVPDCLNDKTRGFGLGLKEYRDEAEAMAAFGDVFLWPDPATLPEGAAFQSAYFNAGDQGAFRQSTFGSTYYLGDQTLAPAEINVIYMTQIQPFVEPKEPHGITTVRGGKTAYTFEPPFRKGLHSIQWKENCRLASVIADLPADEVKRIAEGLYFPTPGPNNLP